MNKAMRTFAAALLLLFITSFCMAQEGAKRVTIEAIKKGLGYRYTYETKPLVSWNDFSLVMAGSPESLSQLKKARTSGTVSMVLGSVGGALIGWPIGTAAVGGDPNWWLAAAGGGVVVVGIVFSGMSAKQLKKSVDIYNESVALVDGEPKSVEIVFAPNGLYVSVRL